MKKRFPHKNNILLVNITRLGDMLQSTPTIAGMKMENPNCKITIVVEKQFEAVCHCIPNIDEVISIDLALVMRSLERGKDGIIDAYEYIDEFITDLRARKFDYVLNMSSSAYTALLLNLLGISQRGGWSADEEGHRVIESEWARLFASSVFHRNREYNSLNLVDVFRASADVDLHPERLLISVQDEDRRFVQDFLSGQKFENTGPIIVVQAGASQAKRQWPSTQFAELLRLLDTELHARIVLSGTKKELAIIEPIVAAYPSKNVAIAAGKTNIPQLTALLEAADILVTGDTGPMHISVAVDTPVVAMFLASAFGFETGPYCKDSIIIQPVISCGPCNPNKACFRPDCHLHVTPKLVADLTRMRLAGPIESLPGDFANPREVILYKSVFDEFGFVDLQPLQENMYDHLHRWRRAYRLMWLNDLGGFPVQDSRGQKPNPLAQYDQAFAGLELVWKAAEQGTALIERLRAAILNSHVPAAELGQINEALAQLDNYIETLGFDNAPLGFVTRMFVFSKENISGSEPLSLASQMLQVYGDLRRRAHLLACYYQGEGFEREQSETAQEVHRVYA